MKKYFVARVEENADADGDEVFVRLTGYTENLLLAENWRNWRVSVIEESYWDKIVILSLEVEQ